MKRSGFTIIEMLVVVIIIAILAGLVFKMIGAGGASSDVAKARRQVEMLANACEEYRAEYGRYPPVARYYDKEFKKLIQPVVYGYPGRGWLGGKNQSSVAEQLNAIPRTKFEEYNIKNDKEAYVFKFGLLSFLVPRIEGHAEMAPKEFFDNKTTVSDDQHHWLSQNSKKTDSDQKHLSELQSIGRRPSDWNYSDYCRKEDNPRDLRVAKKIAPLLKDMLRDNDPSHVDPYGNFATYTNRHVRIVDPWGHSLRYESDPPFETFRVWSRGPDGKDGSADDISSGNEN